MNQLNTIWKLKEKVDTNLFLYEFKWLKISWVLNTRHFLVIWQLLLTYPNFIKKASSVSWAQIWHD